MTPSLDPLTAVTHPDPYPYYAQLVQTQPLYYDAPLEMWVATSADMVSAVLESPLCRVRPAAAPVPPALLGSPAADIFRYLVRMNDGAQHDLCKHAVAATIDSLTIAHAAAHSTRWARQLATSFLDDGPDRLADIALHLPVYVMGSVLGVPDAMLPQVAMLVDDFVGCLAPASSAEQVERGKQAAAQLYALFDGLVQAHTTQRNAGLLVTLAREARRLGGMDADSIIANGIGLLTQAYEATAGLIGTTVLLLAARDDLRHALRAHPALLHRIIQEVMRYDAPVQNTQRFVADAGAIGGQQLPDGATILVVLAAANRDPQANRDPARFDPDRMDRRMWTFGLGDHACPGAALAAVIAEAGITALADQPVWPHLCPVTRYRPSVNARIPLLGRSEHS